MATTNLSEYDFESVPDASRMRFGIVVSEWNNNITGALLHGAQKTLMKHGAKEENIKVMTVPGSFELIYGAAQMTKSGFYDAVIAIGCVVRGDTPHFDYICAGTTQGLAELNVSGNVPVIYGLITTNNMQQAADRAGGCLGNKGDECAVTAIKMVNYAWMFKK
jgi:6,7-dimethyl-8-ribityllumazine synthase